MLVSTLFQRRRTSEHTDSVEALLDAASHSRDFYVLLVGAVLLAAAAIYMDSIPTLIASMVIAPLAQPILALGFAIATLNKKLLLRLVGLFLLACGISFVLAIVVTLLFNDTRVDDVFIGFTGNRILAAIVALVAGAIGAYGVIRPKVSSVITGVAIGVSLMPPLVATGIGVATNDMRLAGDAFILFAINVVSILVASTIMFIIFGVHAKK